MWTSVGSVHPGPRQTNINKVLARAAPSRSLRGQPWLVLLRFCQMTRILSCDSLLYRGNITS